MYTRKSCSPVAIRNYVIYHLLLTVSLY